jgi:hypothetical protein
MTIVIYGHAANIHADLAGLDRNEGFFLSRQRIVNVKHGVFRKLGVRAVLFRADGKSQKKGGTCRSAPPCDPALDCDAAQVI